MNHPDTPERPEPGTSEEVGDTPSSGTDRRPQPTRQRPGPLTPDKEGGAPVDELDLDGDGSRRQ